MYQAAAVPFFPFYNDRQECANRIEEFKNGFAADRLSCHRFRANAFRLLLHSFAYHLVNLFRLQLPSSLRIQLFKTGARYLPGQRGRGLADHRDRLAFRKKSD
jgi:hypothetical protein